MRTITLSDGPHMIDVPRVPAFIFLQRYGYELSAMFGRDAFFNSPTDPNFQAIADHLCALLVASEPHAEWTPEKVAELMVFEETADYITTMQAVAEEGTGGVDPKASSPTSPTEGQS